MDAMGIDDDDDDDDNTAMYWGAEMKDTDSWSTLFGKIFNGMSLLHEAVRMHNPILCDHIDSRFYSDDDKDLLQAVRYWKDVLYTFHLYELATPDNILEISTKKTAAAKLYDGHMGFLEGLYQLLCCVVTRMKNQPVKK